MAWNGSSRRLAATLVTGGLTPPRSLLTMTRKTACQMALPEIRKKIMNALLSLEPRLAGPDTIDPDAVFADLCDELHSSADRLPNLCFTGTTPSLVCVLSTHVCP